MGEVNVGKYKFLFLEDNPLDAHLVIERLKQAGYDADIVHVAGREEFLHALKSDKFDLILSDYTLPAWDGMQALELARNIAGKVPFIFVSGTMGEDAGVEAFRRGATDYIGKTRLLMLPNAVDRALREHSLSEQQTKANEEISRAADLMRENEKLAIIGRLVATIVHEINNPLEAVSNLVYLLGQDPELTPSARQYVDLTRKELDRVIQITKQTLNFYREAAEPVEVTPSDLIEEVLVLFGRKIESRQVQLEKDYHYTEKIKVLPGELRQVLANLVGNAVDATGPGGKLRIRIRHSRLWSDEGVTGIRIVVADSGSGMSEETMKNLGHPFFTRKGQRGTGLGVWVTKRIITKYGGTLSVRSTTGQRHGSVFSVFLPTTFHPAIVSRGSKQVETERKEQGGPSAVTG